MKICPYCSQKIPEGENKCSGCGKEYWIPGKTEREARDERTEEVQKLGCLQILFMPLAIALFSGLFLIFCGFIINLLINFESNQVKIIWIVSSSLAGFAIYLLLSKIKKQSRK